MNTYYSQDEITSIGFRNVGENVIVSRNSSIIDPGKVSLGNNVRIDDYCIITGDVTIGNFVHIAAYVALYGGAGIEIGNYCGISPRSTIFSASDDYSGSYLVSPLIPEEYKNVICGKVIMRDFANICTNSTIMPDVEIRKGAVVGAHSFVTESLNEWGIYAGVPAKWIKARNKTMETLIHKVVTERVKL
jgi:galactoside O-acetyltransferase